MNMILIADSGSTKTHWCLLHHNATLRSVVTPGINPVLQDDADIDSVLSEKLIPALGDLAAHVHSVWFYGAGVILQQQPRMQRLLAVHFTHADIHVATDLLGAARALFILEEGIACILGTGSNSGCYDGNELVENVPPLGFILGDEGSGAVMGKRFLGNLYKGLLPEALRDDFEQTLQLDMAEVIRRVYRSPMPNRFLASFAPYIAAHLDCTPLHEMVVEHFRLFFQRNVAAYDRPDLPVGVVGSIAHHFRPALEEAAHAEGFSLKCIMQSPIEGLAEYHIKTNS